MAKGLRSRHWLEPEVIVLDVVGGSVVTTATPLNTGILTGQHVAKIRRDATGSGNLYILTFNKNFGTPPAVFFQPKTLDCDIREELNFPTKSELRFKIFNSDRVTALPTANFRILIIGNRGGYDGSF